MRTRCRRHGRLSWLRPRPGGCPTCRDRPIWHAETGSVPGMAAWSIFACRLSWCALPSARRASAAALSVAAAPAEGVRDFCGMCSVCPSHPPYPGPNVAKPFGLSFGQLAAVDGAADHIVDKLAFAISQLVDARPALQGDLVPRRPIDAMETAVALALFPAVVAARLVGGPHVLFCVFAV